MENLSNIQEIQEKIKPIFSVLDDTRLIQIDEDTDVSIDNDLVFTVSGYSKQLNSVDEAVEFIKDWIKN